MAHRLGRGRAPRALPLLLVFAAAGACAELSFTPPDYPVHDDREDGRDHARLKKYPFLCGDTQDPARTRVPCPDTRPSDPQRWSCDSSGCHGNFDYTAATRDQRHLRGSDGPSCYACHDVEWKSNKDKTVSKEEDSDDDDDDDD